MSQLSSFQRKMIYITCIVILLFPLSWLSAPATTGTKDTKGSPGGQLAQMRKEYDISQANLGEIDMASQTYRLASLGMTGPAVMILWNRSIHYKKVEDWNNFSSSLKQISKLQPNFIYVWKFQAWNTTYNVSVEFDDFNDRYDYVMEGIEYLIEGTRYNKKAPRLWSELGWYLCHKIGRSDEREQFRELFKRDKEFHLFLESLPTFDLNNPDTRGPDHRPDNWLVGRNWYLDGERIVVQENEPVGNPPLFFSHAPMAQIYYAIALNGDGVFGEFASNAWKDGSTRWTKYSEQWPFYSENFMNSKYWKLRTKVEQDPLLLETHELGYKAKKAYAEARLVEAERLYVESFKNWRELFRKYPRLQDNFGTELMVLQEYESYQKVLLQLERKLPEFKSFMLIQEKMKKTGPKTPPSPAESSKRLPVEKNAPGNKASRDTKAKIPLKSESETSSKPLQNPLEKKEP